MREVWDEDARVWRKIGEPEFEQKKSAAYQRYVARLVQEKRDAADRRAVESFLDLIEVRY